MEESKSPTASRDGLTKIFKNLGWLVGGKGFGAACSLAYLAILARSLGLKDFGHFSLIFGIAQALVAITGFQTWQTVIRYGAEPIQNAQWDRFGRLAWLCGMIDVAGAILGCAVAVTIFYGFSEALSLNPKYVNMALAFNCALMWSRMTTPSGIVRALDRFDIGSYVEAVIPAGRLIASIGIAATGPTVAKFLFAWAFFDLLSGVLYWVFAWRLVPDALHRVHFGKWRKTLAENPGLSGFFGITFVSSTLDALYKQGPLLAVGYFLGTSAAGLYRFADQLAQGVGRFSGMVTRAVFPEFAASATRRSAIDFRALVRQVSLMTGAGGVVIVGVTLLFGHEVLQLLGGDDFGGGTSILLALAIGSSFELAAVAFEPLLFSTGYAWVALLIRSISVGVLALGILAFVSYGAVGVGWAVALGLLVAYVAMSFATWYVLRVRASYIRK